MTDNYPVISSVEDLRKMLNAAEDRSAPFIRSHLGADIDGKPSVHMETGQGSKNSRQMLVSADVFKKYLEEERAAGRDVKQWERSEQALNEELGKGAQKKHEERAKEEIQEKVTKPAEAVKAGVIGHGSQFGLMVDQEEIIRGSLDYKIVRGEDGKLTAQVKPFENGPVQTLKSTDTVKQTITATLDGVDGKPPREVRFEVGKDGTLTEIQAQATPKGNTQGAAQQYR